jgi:hypothetical protein
MARQLRPVEGNNADKKPNRGGRPKKLATAVSSDDEREFLVVLRRQIAAKLDEGISAVHAMSSLIKQLRDIDHEIRAIDARRALMAAEEAAYGDDGGAEAEDWNPASI